MVTHNANAHIRIWITLGSYLKNASHYLLYKKSAERKNKLSKTIVRKFNLYARMKFLHNKNTRCTNFVFAKV